MKMANTELWTRETAAAYLDLAPQTLAAWASTRRYPLRYVKVGRLVRYRKSDLDDFLAKRTIGGPARRRA
jgi:excisionase family DNA binding protein